METLAELQKENADLEQYVKDKREIECLPAILQSDPQPTEFVLNIASPATNETLQKVINITKKIQSKYLDQYPLEKVTVNWTISL